MKRHMGNEVIIQHQKGTVVRNGTLFTWPPYQRTLYMDLGEEICTPLDGVKSTYWGSNTEPVIEETYHNRYTGHAKKIVFIRNNRGTNNVQ